MASTMRIRMTSIPKLFLLLTAMILSFTHLSESRLMP